MLGQADPVCWGTGALMRILYVLTSLGVGGAERQVVGLAERMAARGHGVALLVLKGPAEEQWPTTLKTLHLNMRKSPASVLRGLWRARRFVRAFGPDVVHGNTFPGNMMARMLGLLHPSSTVISTIHNVYEGGWQRMAAYRMTDFLSHRTTAVSSTAARRYVRVGAVSAAKCVAVLNGIETAAPAEDATSQDAISVEALRGELGAANHFVWLAAGRVVPAKDYENLLQALVQVRLSEGDTRLWVAGLDETSEGERLRDLARRLGVEDAVSWLGLRRDLPKLFQAADGFVLSSAWEGMPLVVGEAMAMARPVVATDVGGVGELVGSAGVIVPAKDATALAGAMREMQRRSPEERAGLGAAARERIRDGFSMEARADEWDELYGREVKADGARRGRLCWPGLWPDLIGPLVAATGFRLMLLAWTLARTGTAVITSGDTASYLLPGRSLLLAGRYATEMGPEIDRTPGYPLFLAMTSLPGVVWAVVLQVVVSVLSVYVVARVALRLFAGYKNASKIAVMAAWLLALEPASIVYSIRLLPESLFVLLLLVCVDRMVEFLSCYRLRTLGWAGVWLAAATYVRPASYYLPLGLAVGLACVLVRRRRLRWQAPLLLLAVALPLIGVWQVRNLRETGFAGFSSIVAKNLYFYQAAAVTARVEHRSFVSVQRELGYPDEASYVRQHPEQAGWTAAQRAAYEQAQATVVLRRHPWVYLKSHLTGSAIVLFTPCAADLLRLVDAFPYDAPQRVMGEGIVSSTLKMAMNHPWAAATMALFEAVLLGLYALAFWTIFRGILPRRMAALLLGVAIYFIAISGGAQAVGRYRLPAMPMVCLFAAGAVCRVGLGGHVTVASDEYE